MGELRLVLGPSLAIQGWSQPPEFSAGSQKAASCPTSSPLDPLPCPTLGPSWGGTLPPVSGLALDSGQLRLKPQPPWLFCLCAMGLGPVVPGLSSLPVAGPCVPCECSKAHVGPSTEKLNRNRESSVLACVPCSPPPVSLLISNECKPLRTGKSPSLACCLSSCPLSPLPRALPPRLGGVHTPGALMASRAWYKHSSQYPWPPSV